MATKKPRIATYTEKDTLRKFEVLAKSNNRSMSNMLEVLIIKAILEYEQKYGIIKLN